MEDKRIKKIMEYLKKQREESLEMQESFEAETWSHAFHLGSVVQVDLVIQFLEDEFL
jgi:hypothetical protein